MFPSCLFLLLHTHPISFSLQCFLLQYCYLFLVVSFCIFFCIFYFYIEFGNHLIVCFYFSRGLFLKIFNICQIFFFCDIEIFICFNGLVFCFIYLFCGSVATCENSADNNTVALSVKINFFIFMFLVVSINYLFLL